MRKHTHKHTHTYTHTHTFTHTRNSICVKHSIYSNVGCLIDNTGPQTRTQTLYSTPRARINIHTLAHTHTHTHTHTHCESSQPHPLLFRPSRRSLRVSLRGVVSICETSPVVVPNLGPPPALGTGSVLVQLSEPAQGAGVNVTCEQSDDAAGQCVHVCVRVCVCARLLRRQKHEIDWLLSRLTFTSKHKFFFARCWCFSCFRAVEQLLQPCYLQSYFAAVADLLLLQTCCCSASRRWWCPLESSGGRCNTACSVRGRL